MSFRLLAAEAAVAYVESVVKFPSRNRPEDEAHRKMQVHNLPRPSIRKMRRELEDRWSKDFMLNYDPTENVSYFYDMADIAVKRQAGNCGELAAIVFQWLVKERKVDSVSYYQMVIGGKAAHAFLLLGEASPQHGYQNLDNWHIPAGWPLDAVWCDPWRREWFEVKDNWQRRVRMILRDCGHGYAESNKPWQFSCAAYGGSSSSLSASKQGTMQQRTHKPLVRTTRIAT